MLKVSIALGKAFDGFPIKTLWFLGIPQFRMLSPQDQATLFRLNFANVSFPLYFYYIIDDCKKFKQFLVENNTYLGLNVFAAET